MKRSLFAALAVTALGSVALADAATDQIIADLQSQGFQRIEIDTGIGQIKVEAIRGMDKIEVVYDRATGSILKQEVERVRTGEDTTPGVSIRDRDRDFVDTDRRRDRDDDDDHRRGRDDDDRDDESDDKDRDDDRGDDRGGRDDPDRDDPDGHGYDDDHDDDSDDDDDDDSDDDDDDNDDD